ncbi:MAG: terminase small subunit [Dehalococcoidia bacterium]|nr:terminase small subunit [Dehalococcoidia bacterium]
MKSPLTPKQEIFCLKWIELGNASQAVILAGYKTKNPDVIGAQNLAKLSIQTRIAELRQKTEDATVATVLERKQVLTEITRGRFADFVGKGLTEQKLKSAALQEIRVTEFSAGETSTKKTTIKLHSPIQAIAELNKMDGIYREGMTVNIDNRRLEITVSSEKTRELLKEIEEGKQPHQEEK